MGLLNIPAFDPKPGVLNAIIETPKGSGNKLAFDPERDLFRLKSELPQGMVFPFDFGFVPSTRAAVGDPIDVLVLTDPPTYPGVLIEARAIGVIEAEQTERDGKTERNDRLIAVATCSRTLRDVHKLDDLSGAFVEEIEHFFVAYNNVRGKKFKPIGRKGPKTAEELIRAAMIS